VEPGAGIRAQVVSACARRGCVAVRLAGRLAARQANQSDTEPGAVASGS